MLLSLTMDNIHFAISLSPAAMSQIKLMKELDYTLDGQHLRASIKGKECDGFRYALGFSGPQSTDVVLSYPEGIYLLLDPFIAQYFTRGEIDFEQNESEEGFVIHNHDEEKYHGKFFAKDEEKGTKS